MVIIGTPRSGMSMGKPVDLYALANMPHPGRTFLGVGRRSPIMANGRPPGMRSRYSTGYAERLDEVFSENHRRLFTFYTEVQASAFGGLDTSSMAPIDRQALHYMAQKGDPLA